MAALLSNLLGALALGCADLQHVAMGRAAGLGAAELAALLAVFTRPGSTIGEVASTTALTHSGAVRVTDRLAAAGLVKRREGRDRRTVTLRCTAAGRERAEHALAARRAALGALVATLPSADAATLRRLAARLLARLPADRAEARRICRLCEHAVCRGTDCPVGSAVS
ncbi:MAG TPA: MarR family transcriptional regulator [Alphaproteobacteria bacterium]|nr:MarR family transcriptional regulator [Alphaproteobacteria bacterium]